MDDPVEYRYAQPARFRPRALAAALVAGAIILALEYFGARDTGSTADLGGALFMAGWVLAVGVAIDVVLWIIAKKRAIPRD